MPRVSTTPSQQKIDLELAAIEQDLRALIGERAALAEVADRFFSDAAATRFHLTSTGGAMMVAILGGTGTGKSTLLNRLLEANVSAASFRRTFTAGPVAVCAPGHAIPANWLGLPAVALSPSDLPARGTVDGLAVARFDHPLLQHATLIDTPDLDGDQPAHHAQANRVFRWAQAVIFLVTPEKYQMTELAPYYRLSKRYDVPALFVMNKADARDQVEDFARVLSNVHGVIDAPLFALPRDDAAFEPQPEEDLAALRHAIISLRTSPPARTESRGILTRVLDLLQRARDQVLDPLLHLRHEADRVTRALAEFSTPPPEVNVHPITRQLQKRLQQRSVLYLMGPGRVLDRVRQVPLMLARLPRNTWDLLRHGQLRGAVAAEEFPDDWRKTGPNFRGALIDQFSVLQGRIDDLMQSSSLAAEWSRDGRADVALDPTAAGKIADDEIAELTRWLEGHWNAVPRDTRVVKSLLKVIPGGAKLVRLSEAAPYLLAVVVAAHHSVFGPVDLLVLGGFSLATWLSEKLSNEVAARTRSTNARIGQRFAQLGQEQIDRTIRWIARQAPPLREIERVIDRVNALQEQLAT